MNRVCCALALIVLSATPSSAATIVWDYSPATTGAALSSNFQNQALFQNFAEDFSFAGAMAISGIDIYSGSAWGSVGQPVTIRLWSDNAGTPGILVNKVFSVVSIVDADGAVGDQTRKFASFADINLVANTAYWIGMSGTNAELAQVALGNPNAPDDALMAQFSGTSYTFMAGVGDMAFRLHGTELSTTEPQQVVPEPSSILLFGTGAAAMLVAVRRRRKQQGQ